MGHLESLTAFAAVTEAGSFSGAARRLGMSAPAMTRTIAQLEAHLGVTLFHRTTRSVSLTEEGHALRETANELIRLWQSIEHSMLGRQDEPQGELQVTAPTLLAGCTSCRSSMRC